MGQIKKIVELFMTNDNENIALAGAICVSFNCRRKVWKEVIKTAEQKQAHCTKAADILNNQMYKGEIFMQSFYQTANALGVKPWELRG